MAWRRGSKRRPRSPIHQALFVAEAPLVSWSRPGPRRTAGVGGDMTATSEMPTITPLANMRRLARHIDPSGVAVLSGEEVRNRRRAVGSYRWRHEESGLI